MSSASNGSRAGTGLIGQPRAARLLARAVDRGLVGHAYLLLGPAGVGKMTVARLFAQAVNCSGDRPVGQLSGCGACPACRWIEIDTHPDVVTIRPGSRTGQDINVEQAHDLRKHASRRPNVGRRRVYLVPNAEVLNEAAANALLKTLEEPAEQTTFVLCAPSSSRLLPTLVSRCQVVRFGPSPAAHIAEALVARGVPERHAVELARASGGRPGVAFHWSAQPEVLAHRDRVQGVFLEALRRRLEWAANPAAGVHALRLAECLRDLVRGEADEEDARPAKVRHSEDLDAALGYLRDYVLLVAGASEDLVQNLSRLPELKELAAGTDELPDALDCLRPLLDAQQHLERNVPPLLAFERMFWNLITRSSPLLDPMMGDAA